MENKNKKKINIRGTVGVISKAKNNKDNTIVMMAHGLRSNKDSKTYLALEEIFNRENIDTLRIDLFAHGESKGKEQELTATKAAMSIKTMMDYSLNQGYERIALVGSSFGGLASLIYTSSYDVVELLALKAPVSNLKELIEKELGNVVNKWKKNKTYNWEGMQLGYDFYEDKNNNILPKAPSIKANTFIIHGTADNVVPIEQSRTLCEKIKKCELREIEGADHRFSEEKHFRAMISYLASFILTEWRDKQVWIQ